MKSGRWRNGNYHTDEDGEAKTKRSLFFKSCRSSPASAASTTPEWIEDVKGTNLSRSINFKSVTDFRKNTRRRSASEWMKMAKQNKRGRSFSNSDLQRQTRNSSGTPEWMQMAKERQKLRPLDFLSSDAEKFNRSCCVCGVAGCSAALRLLAVRAPSPCSWDGFERRA